MRFFHKQIRPEYQDPLFLIGVVTSFNPSDFTVDVKLDGVAYLTAVPILGMYGSGYGREMTVSSSLRGARVALVKIQNTYYMLNTLPERSSDGGIDMASQVTGDGFSGEDPTMYGRTGCKAYRAGRASDFLNGDKVWSTDGGSMLALFREGMAKLKASPLAQIILFKYKELVRIVSRRFQIYTDFGELEFTSDGNGKTGFSLKGGALSSSESHPTTAKHTIQVWGGTCPAGDSVRFQMKVGSADGAGYCETTVDTEGAVTVTSTKGVTGDYAGKEEIMFAEGGSRVYLDNFSTVVTGNLTLRSTEKLMLSSAQKVSVAAPEVILNSPYVKVSGVFDPSTCTKRC